MPFVDIDIYKRQPLHREAVAQIPNFQTVIRSVVTNNPGPSRTNECRLRELSQK